MIYQSKNNPNAHLTVKERKSPSLPVKALHERKMLKGEILDFGCGLGKDIEFLSNKAYSVKGYDPHYQPEYPAEKFDTILCFYVLNVLLPEEQAHVLMAISELLKPGGNAFFAVRRDIKKNGFRYNPKREIYSYQCNVILPYRSVFKTKYCEIYQYQHFTFLNAGKTNVSPFLEGEERTLITESARAFAIFDKFPVNSGHALVIPKRLEADYFQLSNSEQQSCWLVVNRVKKLLQKEFQPDAFNIGMNNGEIAGQTVNHAHIHIIPRYKGDIQNPKGGIRNIIESDVPYNPD